MTKKNLVRRAQLNGIFLLANLLISFSAYAYYRAPNLGEAAQNMLSPIALISDSLYKIFYVLGGSMLAGSFIQYLNHRKNPSAVRLGTPILLFFIGLVFVLLPLVAGLSSSAPSAAY